MPEPIIKKLISSGKDGVNGMATLIEEEAERHILLRALQAGDGVKVEIVDLDGRGNTQDRVIKISSTADLLQGPPGPPGPAGDGTSVVNKGDGAQLFLNKEGLLNFRTLKQGAGIKLTENGETITIEALPTSMSLLPVNNGGTGLNAIENNALILGSGSNQLKKIIPTKTGTVPFFDGSNVIWKQRLVTAVLDLTFDASQQIASATINLPGSVVTITSANALTFTNPLSPMIPVSTQIYGVYNGRNRARSFSATCTFEYTGNGEIIDLVGISATALGTTAFGSAKIIFQFDQL